MAAILFVKTSEIFKGVLRRTSKNLKGMLCRSFQLSIRAF